MPNRDGTGPEGRGPMTGRGRGNCAPRRAPRRRPVRRRTPSFLWWR